MRRSCRCRMACGRRSRHPRNMPRGRMKNHTARHRRAPIENARQFRAGRGEPAHRGLCVEPSERRRPDRGAHRATLSEHIKRTRLALAYVASKFISETRKTPSGVHASAIPEYAASDASTQGDASAFERRLLAFLALRGCASVTSMRAPCRRISTMAMLVERRRAAPPAQIRRRLVANVARRVRTRGVICKRRAPRSRLPGGCNWSDPGGTIFR